MLISKKSDRQTRKMDSVLFANIIKSIFEAKNESLFASFWYTQCNICM